MATKKTGTRKKRAATAEDGPARATTRNRRSDEEKVQLVRQVLESGNQSAEIKRLGIYPNQFYDWKKKFAAQLGLGSSPRAQSGKRGSVMQAAGSLADEARIFLNGRAALLDRMRKQRAELDELIAQLES